MDDCDSDTLPDTWTTANFWHSDRNTNSVPDGCEDCDDDCLWWWLPPVSLWVDPNSPPCLDDEEILTNGHPDCNNNMIPDYCDVNDPAYVSPDNPWDGWHDPGVGCVANPQQLACFQARSGGGSCEANSNGIPDECEIAAGSSEDCNNNLCDDAGDIANGTSQDIQPSGPGSGVPDECEDDCNNNSIPDNFDISSAASRDVWNAQFDIPIPDQVPDECCYFDTPGDEATPDIDRDGDVDADDFARIQQCWTDQLVGSVPANPFFIYPPGSGIYICPKCECGCADFDADSAVGESDLEMFIWEITGPLSGSK
jgi:hypothetical protein